MNIFRILMRIISVTLLASTLICGLYIGGQGSAVDPSSIQFHQTIAIAAVVSGIVTAFLPGKKAKKLLVI